MLCGNCKEQHATADEVRKCYDIEVKQESLTDKQRTFIDSLIAERDTAGLSRVVEEIRKVHERYASGDSISKQEASKLINGLLGCDKLPEEDRWTNVPAGRYALTGSDGHVFFVQVNRPESGRWEGHVFAAYLVGSPGDFSRIRAERHEQLHLLDRLAEDPVAAARLFGDKFMICGRCCSPLSNVRSRAAGFGETCATKVGWPYPSAGEARRMLDERGLSVPSDAEVAQLELAIATEDLGATPDWTI